MLLALLDERLRSGRTAEVLALAERHFGEPDRQPKDAVEIAVFACRAARARGEWALVIQWAEAGLALRTRQPEAEGWLQLFLGVGHLYRSNLARADEALAKLEHLVARSPKLKGLAPYGAFSRAILSRLRQNHDDEVRCLQLAAERFSTLGYVREPLQCRLELAWAHLLQNEPALAASELDGAAQGLAQYGDRELSVDHRIVRSLYCKQAGDLRQAEELCRSVLDEESLPARQMAEALWVQGSIAQARGNLALAKRLGEEAYAYALEDYWPPQVDRIERLRMLSVVN